MKLRRLLGLVALWAATSSFLVVTIQAPPVGPAGPHGTREDRDPMPNVYQGRCADCGATVLAQSGYFDEALGCFCALHGGIRKLPDPPRAAPQETARPKPPKPEPKADPPPSRKARIRLVLPDARICPGQDKAEIRLTASLSRNDFESFARACSSVGVQRRDSTRLVDIDLVPRLISIFESEPYRFAVDVMPELANTLYSRAGDTREAVAAAESRARKFDLELRKRGKYLFPYQKSGVDRLAQSVNILLADDMGLGKGSALWCKLLTPKGWTTYGDVKVGDVLVGGSTGWPCRVTAVYDRGVLDLFRVVFSDGAVAYCDDDHLWPVEGGPKELREIRADLGRDLSIPCIGPVDFEPGAGAGDVDARRWARTRLERLTHLGYALRESATKVGSAGGVDTWDFSRDPPSARTVQILAWSTGATAKLSLDGSRPLLEIGRGPRRIVEVQKVGREPIRCISVDDPAHLYVTDDYVVTHNTIQALAAAPSNQRILVVCPAIMKGSIIDGKPAGGWAGATAAWRPDYKITILHGRASFRWPEPGEVVITNFDILAPTQEELDDAAKKKAKEEKAAAKAKAANPEPEPQADQGDDGDDGDDRADDPKPKRKKKPTEEPKPAPPAPDGVIVIADEAQAFVNPDSKRTQRFRALVKGPDGVLSRKGRCWALTGTPLMNRPDELWSVLDSIGLAQVAFGSWTNYTRLFNASRFQVSKNRWQILWGEPSPEVPKRLSHVMLRRLKKDVIKDLPEKTWKTLVVEIDKATLKLCDETVTELDKAGLDIEQALDIAESAKDKVAFAAMSKVREALARAKAPHAVELAEEYESQGEPVLFFSAHRVVVDFLSNRKRWGSISGDGGTVNIDGKIVKVAKPEVVVRHQRKEIDYIACTIQAAGTGVDGLQDRISHCVFVDEVWTPGQNAQALARIERMGQGRKMLITRMIANHVLDHRVADVLARKEKLFEDVVNAAADREADEEKARFDVATDLERAATRIPPPWRLERGSGA